MASDKNFVELVAGKIAKAGKVSHKAMFGEYAIYVGQKLVALICDNQLFVKPTEKGRAFVKDPVEAPPYPGAKPSFLIQEKISDSVWLTKLIKITADELPLPKAKKKKAKAKK